MDIFCWQNVNVVNKFNDNYVASNGALNVAKIDFIFFNKNSAAIVAMATIYDLPHELVAAIGDHLLPKYRCRLFICCHEWYQKCYMHCNIIPIYKKMYLNLRSIQTIQYNICHSNENVAMSELIKPDGTIIYFEYNAKYSDINNSTITVINDFEHFTLIDGESIYVDYTNVFESNMMLLNYELYRSRYNRCYMYRNDLYRYKVYKCLGVLKYFLPNNDYINMIVAFGRRFYHAFVGDNRTHKIW